MKSIIFFTLSLLSVSFFAGAQKSCIDHYFMLNPSNIKANPEKQDYRVSLKWQNLDVFSGNKINCSVVNAIFTTGLQDGFASWKDVTLSQIKDFNQTTGERTEMPAFNNFTYKAMTTDFLKTDFYKSIPLEQRDLARWLVSDAVQMQGLATYVFDSLRLNKAFSPKILENNNLQFENWVLFTSRYQKLIWTGISKFNNELCAIVKFESYFNPVSMNQPAMTFKGRSLYWGELWISLEDKQLEYAIMMEDVVFNLKSSQFPDGQLLDLQREVNFEKIINR